MSVRLSIQRSHAAPEYNSILQECSSDSEYTIEYLCAGEDVIEYVFSDVLLPRLTSFCSLRIDRGPYMSFYECAKRIYYLRR